VKLQYRNLVTLSRNKRYLKKKREKCIKAAKKENTIHHIVLLNETIDEQREFRVNIQQLVSA